MKRRRFFRVRRRCFPRSSLPAQLREIMKNPHLRQSVSLLFLIFIAPLIKTGAEPENYVRLHPGVYLPRESDLFGTGFGAAAALDWRLFPFFGLSAQGEYITVPIQSGDSVTLLDGGIGPSFIWRPANRFSLLTDITAGVYSARALDRSISGISAGARLSASWHVSPYLNLTAFGGVKHFSYTPEPFMNTVSIGLSISLNLSELMSSETRIYAEKIRQGMVFPVSYAWYNENPFAAVRITNHEPNDITAVAVSFYLEQYMVQPKLCATETALRPGESVEIPLTAFFNESILQLTENITANARVIVEYRSLGSLKRAEVPLEIPIYHRNAMSWDDDRRASSFVSARDPAAQWFSRYVSLLVQDHFRPGINRNMQYALGFFEALNVYGINYIVDPSSSYVALSGSSGNIDSLNYPYQTLLYRGGDCDDLAILFSSLMEAAGIQTAFITIPGHIYMAFDSGMSEEEARRDFYASADLVYHEGRAWVPLEITIPREGFYRAWRIGAKEWRDAAGRGEAAIFPMRKSWELYPPVSVPGASSRFNLPEEKTLALAFDRSLDTYIEHEIRPRVRGYETLLAQGENPGVRNELGVLYGRYGMLERAKEQFARAAEMESIHGRINLGNIAFLEQRYEDALGYYQDSLTRQPDNALALLGIARCYYELNDFAASDAYYARVRRGDAGLARSYAYLASFFETRGRAYSLSDRFLTATWSLPASPAADKPADLPPEEPAPPSEAAAFEDPVFGDPAFQPDTPASPPAGGAPPLPEPVALPPPPFTAAAADKGKTGDDEDENDENNNVDETGFEGEEPPETGGLSGMLSIGETRLQSVREEIPVPPVPAPPVSAVQIPSAPIVPPPPVSAVPAPPAPVIPAPQVEAAPPPAQQPETRPRVEEPVVQQSESPGAPAPPVSAVQIPSAPIIPPPPVPAIPAPQTGAVPPQTDMAPSVPETPHPPEVIAAAPPRTKQPEAKPRAEEPVVQRPESPNPPARKTPPPVSAAKTPSAPEAPRAEETPNPRPEAAADNSIDNSDNKNYTIQNSTVFSWWKIVLISVGAAAATVFVIFRRRQVKKRKKDERASKGAKGKL
jgi:tetratricopeptide (TPR) repeat protein